MHKSALNLIGVGAIGLALSLVMGWLGFSHMIKDYIRRNAQLQPGGDLYSIWSEPNAPIHVKFYFFNVTNVDEFVEQGGEPKVTEVGPYTYLKQTIKMGIEPGELNGTLRYQQYSSYHFMPASSLGTEEDLITFANVPFVSFAKTIMELLPEPKLHEMINDKLVGMGETLFKTASMKQLLFDGISLNKYVELMKSLNGNIKIPQALQAGQFGLYLGKNDSVDTYEVDNGISNWKEVAQIREWNNMTSLPWWKTDDCNTLRGTDGTIFKPVIAKSTKLTSFTPETCRAMTMEFEKLVEFQGFPLYRFVTSRRSMQGTKSNRKNACYCTEEGIASELCERDGFLMMSGCMDGSPISLSAPHFYGVSAAAEPKIDGLNPNEEKHKTFLDIEPYTGFILRAAKRMQTNVDLQQYESMGSFTKVPNMAFPIMWMEETVEVPDENLGFIKQLYWVIGMIGTGKFISVGISAVVLGFGVVVGLLVKDDDDIQVQPLVR